MTTLENEGVVTKKQSKESLLFYRGKGCKKCGNSGYKGRLGIYETLEVDADIRELVIRNASGDEIMHKAREKGMLTILEDGFIKAKSGVTTIEEILRVTKQ
jgi:type IV pilus assembly protein PilB